MASWRSSASSRSSCIMSAAHHLVELPALLGRQALHERLHRPPSAGPSARSARRGSRRRGSSGPTCAMNASKSGSPPSALLAQHLVQVPQHLAHAGQVLRRHALERLLHALERLHHLLAQRLQQLLELLLGLGVHEVVVLQLAQPAGRVRAAMLRRSFCSRCSRARAPSRRSCRSMPCALGLHDLLELLLDVLQAGAEVVAVELLLPLARAAAPAGPGARACAGPRACGRPAA